MFIALLLAAAAPSPVCAKLTKDFEGNERLFAFVYDLDARLLEIEVESHKMMAAAERDLAIAQAQASALGVYVPPKSGSGSLEKIAERRKKLEETDQKYKSEGDRITNLLVANKCQPPDHVTSWYTYSQKNPNAAKQ